jgi:hypothetical protein
MAGKGTHGKEDEVHEQAKQESPFVFPISRPKGGSKE